MGSTLTTKAALVHPHIFPAPEPSNDNDAPWLKWINDIPVYWKRISRKRPTIIYSHANNCYLGQCVHIVDILAEALKVNIIAYEYPGYGLFVVNHQKRIFIRRLKRFIIGYLIK